MNPLLLRFLDAESYRDKLELFQAWEAYADEQLLESIAVSLDITLGHGLCEGQIPGDSELSGNSWSTSRQTGFAKRERKEWIL